MAPRQRPLGKQQQDILRLAVEGHAISGGRYGWNTAVLRGLEQRGLVALVKQHTWDSDWRLTEAGRAEGQKIRDAWRKARGL